MNAPPGNVESLAAGPPCPPPEDLARQVADLLEPRAAEVITAHLQTCQRCAAKHRALVGWSRELSQAGDPPAAPPQLFQRLLRVLHPDSPAPNAAAADAAPPANAAPPAVLRDYRLLQKLGEGGMGTVYRAMHTRLDRIVALKILSADRTASARGVARFEREMKAVGRLDHPHIVRAYDAGEADGVHYLAMELVEGIDLERLVLQNGPLSIADACEIVRQAALGLEHAHQHGLVHRDIKPSNLMLAKSGQVKLLDLGLARLNDWAEPETGEAAPAASGAPAKERLTHAGHFIGTIEFIAPEQATHSHAVDIRADIYSLGATLFWLLTGRTLPPRAERAGALPTNCPPLFIKVLDRMLASRPQDRFQTPAEVVAAMEEFADDQQLVLLAGGDPAAALRLSSSKTPVEAKTPRITVARLALAAGGLVLALAITVVLYQAFRSNPEPSPFAQPTATAPATATALVPPPTIANAVPPLVEPEVLPPVETSAPAAKPPEVWSPPPAEELLSRRCRVVRQDGGGEFVTLQAALDAVEAGEVIVVLDWGPYRERLHRDSPLPADVGLYSPGGTRIEIPDWHTLAAGGDAAGPPSHVGMVINAPDGFRMSGFEFSAPPVERDNLTREPCHLLDWSTGGDIVIDNCRFLSNPPITSPPPWTLGGDQERSIDLRFRDSGLARLVLQDNLIEARVSPRGAFSGELIVERNRILARTGIETPEIIPRMVIRHNVIHATNSIVWRTWKDPQAGDETAGGHLITNNVLDSAHPAIWVRLFSTEPLVPGPLDSRVTIQGNILRSHWGGGIVMKPEEWEHVRGTWLVSHNCYLDQPRNLGNGLVAIPLQATDLVLPAPFLSLDESDPDYFRIHTNGPLAAAGTGGALPKYIGALAPGIEPAAGDWFGRFRRRESLLVDRQPRPLVVQQVMPLEAWLQGRRQITVARDGSGDFSTLKEALGALQAGEVVTVLDAGPYRDEPFVRELPADTGLISTAGAAIEIDRWITSPPPQRRFGAILKCAGDFRLEGIRFDLGERPLDAVPADGVQIHAGGSLVIRDCAFRSPPRPQPQPRDLNALVLSGAGETTPVQVERCLLEGSLVCRNLEGPLVLRENLVLHAAAGFDLEPRGGDVVLRHNLVAGSSQGLIYRYAPRASADPNRSVVRLELQNNTFLSSSNPIMVTAQPKTTTETNPNTRIIIDALTTLQQSPQQAIIVNNVFHAGSYYGIQFDRQDVRSTARRLWQINHNAYREEPATDVGQFLGLGRRPADVIVNPLVLSIDPTDPQFGRIAADGALATGGIGGAFPAYIGALAPGDNAADAAWLRELVELRSPAP